MQNNGNTDNILFIYGVRLLTKRNLNINISKNDDTNMIGTDIGTDIYISIQLITYLGVSDSWLIGNCESFFDIIS